MMSTSRHTNFSSCPQAVNLSFISHLWNLIGRQYHYFNLGKPDDKPGRDKQDEMFSVHLSSWSAGKLFHLIPRSFATLSFSRTSIFTIWSLSSASASGLHDPRTLSLLTASNL